MLSVNLAPWNAMIEKTRQKFLLLFLSGVLFLTVLAVGLFAANRRHRITSLAERVEFPERSFSVRMPADWQLGKGQITAGPVYIGHGFVATGPVGADAKFDPNFKRIAKRRIYLLAIPPDAADKDVFRPPLALLQILSINSNDFRALPLTLGPQLGPVRLGKYERRDGYFRFRYLHDRRNYVLIRYQQIVTAGQVFWCVIEGNTPLTAADSALFDAVASSFEFIPSSQFSTSPETPETIRDPEDL